MATTPRSYLWKEAQPINGNAEGTGATFHFYDTQAQAIYLRNNALRYKAGVVPNGHWEDLEWGSEKELEDMDYEFLKSDHPATGSLYMVALHHNVQKDNDILYLFRYNYIRDISELVEECTLNYQVDNPIAQIAAKIKNVKDALFTAEASLFAPSSKLTLGIAFGKGPISTMAIGYTDEVNWRYGSKTVSLSGRNSVGFYLNDQSYENNKKYKAKADVVFTSIFTDFGITKYVIDPLGADKDVELEVNAKDTVLKTIQTICTMITNGDVVGETWDIEETYDGTIVVGYDAFRGEYIPRGTYRFDGKNDVFMQSIDRAIDGVYAKVRCVGTNTSGGDLTPVVRSVTSWKYWSVGDSKIYHAQKLEGTTQEKLNEYAKALAKQLKWIGRVIKYKSPLRPQLVVGDIARVTNGIEVGEDGPNVGTITEIKHTFGQKGYFTEFTLDSGGDPHIFENGRVYTKGKAVGGSNRSTKIMDFFQKETQAITGGSTPTGTKMTLRERGWATFDGSEAMYLGLKLTEDLEVQVQFEFETGTMVVSTTNMAVFGTSAGEDHMSLIGVHAGLYQAGLGASPSAHTMTFSKSTAGRHSFRSGVLVGSSYQNQFDGELVTAYFPETLAVNSSMYLGYCGGGFERFKGKIYRFTVTQHVTGGGFRTIMDLKPYDYIDGDGNIVNAGLYDKISQKFMPNNGGITVDGWG